MRQLGVAIVDPERSSGDAEPIGDRHPTLTTVPIGDPSALSRFVAQRSDLTHVSVLSRPESASAARLLATVAGGQHPSVAITVLVRDVAQVALSSVAMSVLDWPGPPGSAHDHLRQILNGTISGAVLRSVTKLNSPRPSFWQHIKSLWPGESRFVVYHGPDAKVIDASRLPAERVGGAGNLVASGAKREDITALETLMQCKVVQVDPVGEGHGVYGHRATEFAQFGASTQPPDRSCPVCRELTSAASCPFCRTFVTREGVPNQ